MMTSPATAKPGALDLSRLSALIVDNDDYAVGILNQILRGMGLGNTATVASGGAAMESLDKSRFDLVLTEAVLPDMLGADFVKWLRRHDDEGVRQLPVVMLTGHTEHKTVESVRDSGVNTVVKKPVAPAALFDHIAWSAKTDRMFVISDTYMGPDRRFKNLGPPSGVGRRGGHLPLQIGAAAEPNMSQMEIDSFMKAMKIKED